MALVTLNWSEYAPAQCTGGAVTVGNFDGVHRGHQAIITAAQRQAALVGGPTVSVTFSPPPHEVLHPGSERPPLTTLTQRAELLQAAGADHMIVLQTTPALLALSPEMFFQDILVRQLGAKAIVEGADFHFGRGRTGTTATLRQLCATFGLNFEEVPQLTYDGEPVSSSRVRAALQRGDVAHAAKLLARPYAITGTVVAGARRGQTLGFPTANLSDVRTVVPGNGVYAVRAWIGGEQWPAAANIGPNPTFGDDTPKVELHLVGFTGDIYGRMMTAEFVARLRDNRPFNGVHELIEQLRHDVKHATRILAAEIA